MSNDLQGFILCVISGKSVRVISFLVINDDWLQCVHRPSSLSRSKFLRLEELQGETYWRIWQKDFSYCLFYRCLFSLKYPLLWNTKNEVFYDFSWATLDIGHLNLNHMFKNNLFLRLWLFEVLEDAFSFVDKFPLNLFFRLFIETAFIEVCWGVFQSSISKF